MPDPDMIERDASRWFAMLTHSEQAIVRRWLVDNYPISTWEHSLIAWAWVKMPLYDLWPDIFGKK